MPSLATNSANTLTVTVRNTLGALVDPTTISLTWKLGRYGDETIVAQASLTHVSTGVYSYEVTPEDGGEFKGFPVHLFYEWTMTNPNYVERGKVALSSSEFCS